MSEDKKVKRKALKKGKCRTCGKLTTIYLYYTKDNKNLFYCGCRVKEE